MDNSHEPRKCPAFGEEFTKSKKLNHFANYCKSPAAHGEAHGSLEDYLSDAEHYHKGAVTHQNEKGNDLYMTASVKGINVRISRHRFASKHNTAKYFQ